jgi:hypothetical protein
VPARADPPWLGFSTMGVVQDVVSPVHSAEAGVAFQSNNRATSPKGTASDSKPPGVMTQRVGYFGAWRGKSP